MILVTGASGHIGGRVAELLVKNGVPVRRLVRRPETTPDIPNSPLAIADYGDPAALARAMAGIETVFLASAGAAPLKRAALHGNVMDAAAQAGVKRLVYLSFQGASATSPFPYSADHLLSEAHLKQSGLAWTILRDSFYQELVPTLADAEGVIRDPGGDGKVAWVAREDVARSVAAALQDDSHAGRSYDITGPEALSLEEAADRVSRHGERPIRYRRESLAEGRAWRAATGAADWEVDVWLGSYLEMGSGRLAHVSDAVERLTGKAPTSLATNAALSNA